MKVVGTVVLSFNRPALNVITDPVTLLSTQSR